MRMRRTLAAVALLAAANWMGGCTKNDDAKNDPKPKSAETATESKPVALEPGDPESGREVYLSGCVTCHGHGLDGMPHQGPSLKRSKFVASQTDLQLIAFIHKGRAKDDPANTSGVAMPPNGNIPNLRDQQIADVVAYVRQEIKRAKADADNQ